MKAVPLAREVKLLYLPVLAVILHLHGQMTQCAGPTNTLPVRARVIHLSAFHLRCPKVKGWWTSQCSAP